MLNIFTFIGYGNRTDWSERFKTSSAGLGKKAVRGTFHFSQNKRTLPQQPWD